MQAILYTSKTGHTKEYAELVSKQTGLPIFNEKQARKLPKGSEIIYLGWLMAGTIKGYKKANRNFRVQAVCSVGMANNDAQKADICNKNSIPETTAFFYLPGGFEMNKLTGIYKMMMTMMKKTVGKKLMEKQDRTTEENEMLDLLLNGGSRVSVERLTDFLDWFNREKTLKL